jgi:hypothetical protein
MFVRGCDPVKLTGRSLSSVLLQSKRRARVPLRVSTKMSDSADQLPLLATNTGNSNAAAMQGNVMRQRPDS